MTINQLISGHRLANSAKRGPQARSDEELAMVYGGSLSDGLASFASGVAIVGGAIATALVTPVIPAVLLTTLIVVSAAGGVVAGTGITAIAK